MCLNSTRDSCTVNHNSLICDYPFLCSGSDSEEELVFLQQTGGQMMDEQRNGRRADDLRNAAIESILEVTSDFQYVENVDLLLRKICKTVSETDRKSVV